MGSGSDSDNAAVKKSRAFAIRVVKLYQFLCEDKKEYVLSKQLLRSGTSIGANVREAVNAQSKKDFTSKMGIAPKENSEVEYWLDLLHETGYLNSSQFKSINGDCRELIKILTAIVKTCKNR